MSDKTPGPRDKKRFKVTLAYAAALSVTLALAVVGIELSRRRKAPHGPTTAPPSSGGLASRPFPRELRDAAGTTLVIPARPSRIASQTLGTDEILLAICPSERVVALSELAEDENYSNVAEVARQLHGRSTEGAEQILPLKPDLIFVASYSRAETVHLLEATNAPVFRFANFDSIADIESNIRTVGYATGCDGEAEKLIRRMEDELTAVRARVPQGQAPLRVISYGREGYTAGADSLFDDMLRAAGGVNVSAENGLTGFVKISAEKITEWQPDVIVTGADRGEAENVRRQLLADPVVAASRAGRAGRIVVMDNRHFLTVSQYVVRGVEDLANGLYGNQR